MFPARVRGRINISGYLAEPVFDQNGKVTGSAVTYIVHVDPKGEELRGSTIRGFELRGIRSLRGAEGQYY
eukprot:335308-Amorphochlora_amoeboformis.AAC.1